MLKNSEFYDEIEIIKSSPSHKLLNHRLSAPHNTITTLQS